MISRILTILRIQMRERVSERPGSSKATTRALNLIYAVIYNEKRNKPGNSFGKFQIGLEWCCIDYCL